MIFTIIVFMFIILIVYVIRTREINYSFEVAILTGCIVNLLTFLIANLLNDIKIPINIGELILGTIGAGLLAVIVQNFRCALDYTTIERVQFEDDDYFYYVKAIPKIKVVEKKSDIKKIAVQKPVEHKINDSLEENISKDFDDDFDTNFDKGFDNDFTEDKTLEENLNKELKKELDKELTEKTEELDNDDKLEGEEIKDREEEKDEEKDEEKIGDDKKSNSKEDEEVE